MVALAAGTFQSAPAVRSAGASAARLVDGRLHLQHGPIDLIIEAFGEAAAVRDAYAAAGDRFSGILPELVAQLPQLRQPVGDTPLIGSPTGLRMWRAASRFRPSFITPMAAVAGAVADEVLASVRGVAGLRRLYVNNGGDIALWLEGDEVIRLGVIANVGAPISDELPATVRITAGSGVGGIATSGWRGRSHSLGIADAVTVFAADAATADAAATLIANAVNIESDQITRQPAIQRDPDSDLGQRLVTVAVGKLTTAEARQALAAGTACAEKMLAQAQLLACIVFVQGQIASVGDLRA